MLENPSYHLKPIPKGKIGSLSKISEELYECLDAEEQGNRIMLLCELSDLLGAVELFLEKEFPSFTLYDLSVMKDATKRAFLSGDRE